MLTYKFAQLMQMTVYCIGTKKSNGVITIMNEYRGKVNAPEFPAHQAWLNTERPLTMTELRGKIVILEFWTFC